MSTIYLVLSSLTFIVILLFIFGIYIATQIGSGLFMTGKWMKFNNRKKQPKGYVWMNLFVSLLGDGMYFFL